jgi:APA family basic amino acid/polyamine antiporter
MGDMSSLGTLFAFAISSLGVIILRFKKPNIDRPFRCPAVFVVAPLAVIGCSYLMVTLIRHNSLVFIIWTLISVAVYFLYAYRKSPLNTTKIQK